jgi:hypothetical protein
VVPDGALFGRRAWIVLGLALVGLFLLTRLAFIDADIPRWELSWYSPIDEFGYTVPAFNLVRYGTWVHQAAPWAPLEGPPINVLQNLVAAGTLAIGGDTYLGLRGSSVLFGLIAFLALLDVVRRQADDAVRHDGASAPIAAIVVVAAASLLLADFSNLLLGRIVEPTTSRYAVIAVVLWLVARGTLLGERSRITGSAALGALTAGAVLFVYVYCAFLVPAAAVALAWWAWRRGRWSAVFGHLAAFAAGAGAITVAFFAWYALVYRQTPGEWLQDWILDFASTSRGNGFAFSKIASIAQANIFRLDPAFFGLFLAGLAVFAWAVRRRPTAFGVLALAGLGFLVLQSGFVADYPERKFVMFMLFALPIVAGAVLAWPGFRSWATSSGRRSLAALLWLGGSIAVAVAATPLGRSFPPTSNLARVVLLGGALGLVALGVLLASQRRTIQLAAGGALALAIIGPLIYTDLAFVYRHPTFTYRDAQAEVSRTIDGQVTAGAWSLGMQLYNTSEPVLNWFPSHLSTAEYWAAVVRYHEEYGAAGLFDYTSPAVRANLERLGFRVAETYGIILPRGLVFARYVYAPGAATSASGPAPLSPTTGR